MWELRPLTPLLAFTACYRDSFTSPPPSYYNEWQFTSLQTTKASDKESKIVIYRVLSQFFIPCWQPFPSNSMIFFISRCSLWSIGHPRNARFTSVVRTPWTGDQPVARPLPTHSKHKHRINVHTKAGFKPTIPGSERAKTVTAWVFEIRKEVL
jgi:hypothetical protein